MKNIMMVLILLASLAPANAKLNGHVSNKPMELGMIGVRLSSLSKTISKVYPNSPAAIWGLQIGDQIIDVDSCGPNSEKIDGEAYTYTSLTIKRKGEIKHINIIRFEKDSIDWKG